MFKKFLLLLMDPPAFFERVRKEGWKPALIFFLEISVILSIFTAIANYLGVESTDFSSAYQAQILAYRILRDTLLPQYGVYAYFLEVFLILGFAVLLLLFLTGFSHLVFRLMGGRFDSKWLESFLLRGWSLPPRRFPTLHFPLRSLLFSSHTTLYRSKNFVCRQRIESDSFSSHHASPNIY